MARSRQIEGQKVEVVRRHLGEIIGRLHREETGIGTAELSESFELYTIPGDAIRLAADKGYKLRSLLQRTGSWHHQITSGGKPVGIAQSAAPGSISDEWSLQSFFVGPLAQKIAEAIAKIDAERVDDEIEVMLVRVPSYQVDFFLLATDTSAEVYLIQSPSGAADLGEGNFYSEEDFLQKLSAISRARMFTFSPEPDEGKGEKQMSEETKTETGDGDKVAKVVKDQPAPTASGLEQQIKPLFEDLSDLLLDKLGQTRNIPVAGGGANDQPALVPGVSPAKADERTRKSLTSVILAVLSTLGISGGPSANSMIQ